MCGFVGIIGRQDCAGDAALALQALQHRGQDSFGIATLHKGDFPLLRRLGLVSTSFTPEDLRLLPGNTAIGHVRYPTMGSGTLRDTQPFFFRQPGVLMAHNGNFINMHQMEQRLQDESVYLFSRCDIEPVLGLFALELMRRRKRDHTLQDVLHALQATFEQSIGAYSIVAALHVDGQETLMVARDPLGIRPAVWGRRSGQLIATSESVALDALDATLEGDVAPGEVILFRRSGRMERHQLEVRGSAPCVFEYIYFARPDSVMNQRSVYSTRLALGVELAKAWKAKKHKADVVIPIPDTSRPSAGALAEELGLPNREGFIKNRYTGRTFIMANADQRTNALKLKLNPIRSEFSGKRVLVIDDSIVRGTTLKRTIQLIRDQRPREVHLAIHSPPVIHPCYYGIDMSTRAELAAAAYLPKNAHSEPTNAELTSVEKKLARRLGLDSLTYLPLAGLRAVFPESHCAACFDGKYPLRLSEQEREWIEKDRCGSCQRELVL